MPQFDFSTFPSTIFWLFISFMFLIFYYSRYVIPKHNMNIEKRMHKIRLDLEYAKKLNQESEELLNRYQEKIDESRRQADELFEQTCVMLERRTEHELSQIRAELLKKRMHFEENFAGERAVFEESLHQDIEDIVCKIIEKMQLAAPQDIKNV